MVKIGNYCPACRYLLTEEDVKLSAVERKQRWKNLHCPKCKFLLWIPANGPPQPVPLLYYPPHDPFPNASTECINAYLTRKGLPQYV